MPVDMKEVIAEAARVLVFEKKVKKLTVKEIVQECKITRQAFYYHFEDIPELMKWVLERDSEKILKDCLEQDDPEKRIGSFFSFAVSMKPYTERGLQTNYADDITRMLDEFMLRFFRNAVEENDGDGKYSDAEKEMMVRYHCGALKSILQNWTSKDTENMDQIVHQIYQILHGTIYPF